MYLNYKRHWVTISFVFSHTSYLISGWFLFTGFMTVGTIRSSIAFFGLFFLLTLTFMLLAIGFYNGENVHFIKAGGVFGLFTAAFAWYNAIAALWNQENSYMTVPLGRFPWAENRPSHVNHSWAAR